MDTIEDPVAAHQDADKRPWISDLRTGLHILAQKLGEHLGSKLASLSKRVKVLEERPDGAELQRRVDALAKRVFDADKKLDRFVAARNSQAIEDMQKHMAALETKLGALSHRGR